MAKSEFKYFYLGVEAGLAFLVAAGSLLLASVSNSGTITLLLAVVSFVSVLAMVKILNKAFLLSFWPSFLFFFVGILYGPSIFLGVLLGSFPNFTGSILAPVALTLGLWGICGIYSATYFD